MPDTSRVQDQWDGICCCHKDPTCIPMGGWIVTGSGDCGASAFAQARQQDMTIGYCGHTGNIITSSGTCLCNSLGKARVGDRVDGCNIGQIITGAPNFQSGG